MPKSIRAAAERAIERHQRRPVMPDIGIRADGDRWAYSSPYGDDADSGLWDALLLEGFGTRSISVARVFMDQLVSLVEMQYSDDAQAWMPNPDQLRTAINLIAGLKPRNEAEAALAAQMVAVHFALMRTGENIARQAYPDERTAATLARLANAYTRQIEAMQRLKGRRSTTRQSITVRHEKHIHQHHHQHVHVAPDGQDFGERSHETRASATGEREALLSAQSEGSVVSIASGSRKAGLPHARGNSGRTEG